MIADGQGDEAPPRHCPRCGADLTSPTSMLHAYWASDSTIYFCWCAHCGWTGEVRTVLRMIGVEPE